jgi:dynein assembly factor 3, axonemal
LWGFSPAINCFANVDNIDVEDDSKEINVLLSETGGDARHLLKSITDILPLKHNRTKPINFYIHEKQKENLGRLILFLTLVCETGISMRERMEMYLDLFGNCLIRDKTSSYLEGITHELIQLVTEHEKCTSMLKPIFDFSTLKFKERDELEDVLSGYLLAHKYDIESLRDQRMRAHFKERYDHRRNLVDWNY